MRNRTGNGFFSAVSPVIAPALAFAMMGLLTACYQPKEGCLDINATNFSIDADRPCSGCCTYPALILNFQHKVVLPDTITNLAYNTGVYYDAARNPFRIRSIRFYLSDLRLVRPDGEEVGVTDTLQLAVPQAGGGSTVETIEDNFTLADPGDFRQREIGTIRSSGRFNRIRFTLGLETVANYANPARLDDDHPLDAKGMYQGEAAGHLYNRIELYRIIGPDTVTTLLNIDKPVNLRRVELPVDFFLDPGFSPKVILRIDYAQWFSGVNLAANSTDQIIQRIVNNLTNSFSVVEIME